MPIFSMGVDVEAKPSRSEMLLVVMRNASANGYRDHQRDWGSEEDRQAFLDSGKHDDAMRSEDFCSHFWKIPLHRVPSVGPPTDLIYPRLTEEAAWERHHRVLQDHPDPLAYCYENLRDPA